MKKILIAIGFVLAFAIPVFSMGIAEAQLDPRSNVITDIHQIVAPIITQYGQPEVQRVIYNSLAFYAWNVTPKGAIYQTYYVIQCDRAGGLKNQPWDISYEGYQKGGLYDPYAF